MLEEREDWGVSRMADGELTRSVILIAIVINGRNRNGV